MKITYDNHPTPVAVSIAVNFNRFFPCSTIPTLLFFENNSGDRLDLLRGSRPLHWYEDLPSPRRSGSSGSTGRLVDLRNDGQRSGNWGSTRRLGASWNNGQRLCIRGSSGRLAEIWCRLRKTCGCCMRCDRSSQVRWNKIDRNTKIGGSNVGSWVNSQGWNRRNSTKLGNWGCGASQFSSLPKWDLSTASLRRCELLIIGTSIIIPLVRFRD